MIYRYEIIKPQVRISDFHSKLATEMLSSILKAIHLFIPNKDDENNAKYIPEMSAKHQCRKVQTTLRLKFSSPTP